VFELGQDL